MSRHDDRIRLEHMRDHAREVVDMVRDRTRADLDNDRMLNLSVVRLLEIVGEAASRVTPEIQARYDDIPWQSIRGFRNRVVHGYDDVDMDIVWVIVRDELAPVVTRIESILQEGEFESL